MRDTTLMRAKVLAAHAARYNDVEHVTLYTNWRGDLNLCLSRVGRVVDVRTLTTLDAPVDDLHPWERDLVINGEPFARPSRGVRS